jgi:prepilin-type N-terminal cleavage/methylation domain-containing protein
MTVAHNRTRRGFTMIEVLIVLIIILVLAGILIPVVSIMQRRAQGANTSALINQLQTAIETYYQDHRAYPGPLSNAEVYTALGGGTAPAITGATPTAQITGSENLVLGLMGGLYNAGGVLTFDASRIGTGAPSLNLAAPRGGKAYLASAANLSDGVFSDASGTAADSSIPEFVDRFNNPLPVLYLRARVGARSTANTEGDNPIITNGTRTGPYDISQVIGYTSTLIGVGKNLQDYYINGTATSRENLGTAPYHGLRAIGIGTSIRATDGNAYQLPYNAHPYFRDPNTTGLAVASQAPRQRDRYILISAGEDRVYGTADDITNFGAVNP